MREDSENFLCEEEFFFKDEESLVEYLDKEGFSAREIVRTLSHENAHIHKAREFGYHFSSYKVRKSREEIRIIPIFDLSYYLNSNQSERREIALAPEDPSENDFRVAEREKFILNSAEFKEDKNILI